MMKNKLQICNLVAKLVKQAALVGRPLRSKQSVYMQHWLDAITSSADRHAGGDTRTGIVLSSAETGLGKTMGYAIPLMAFASVMGCRVAIATHTHALQRQMMDGDLKRVNEFLVKAGRSPLKIRQRIGQQAFISAQAIESLIHELRTEKGHLAETLTLLESLHDWALISNEGGNSGLIEDAVMDIGELPQSVSRQSICIDVSSCNEDRARYDEHIEETKDADVTLVTHHYLSALALFNGGKNDYAALVVDEADRLTSAIASMSHHEVSLMRLRHSLSHHDLNAAVEAVDGLIGEVQNVGDKNDRAIAMVTLPTKAHKAILSHAAQLESVLQGAFDVLKTAKSLRKKELRTEIKRVLILLRRFSEAEEGGFWVSALSFSPTRRLPSLCTMPMHPGRLIAKLWQSDESSMFAVMMTSATLGIPGHSRDPQVAFRECARELGVHEENELQLPVFSSWGQFEPDKFGAMRFVLADPSANNPVGDIDDDGVAKLDEEWLQYAASMIIKAHRGKNKGNHNRTLVLTRSYRDGDALLPLLQEHIAAEKLIIQQRGQGISACRKMYESPENKNAVWISPAAWEGVDMPGLVQNLVIFRLPLQPDNPVKRALLRGVAKLENKKVDVIMHAYRALVSKRLFRQALGRGIRKEDDKCTVWIPDPRFPVPANNKYLLAHKGKHNYKARQLGYFHQVVPERFRVGLFSREHSPEIFWMPG